MLGGQTVNRNSWGLRPQTPRIYRFRARIWSGLGERVASLPTKSRPPGSALRSHPCGALSSAQAMTSIGRGRPIHKEDEAVRLGRTCRPTPL